MGVAFAQSVSAVGQRDEARAVADRWRKRLAIERCQPRCARRVVAAVVVVACVRLADADIGRPLAIASGVRRRLPLDHPRRGRRVEMTRRRGWCQQREAGTRHQRARETGRGRRDERQAEDRAQCAPADSNRMSGEPARRLDDHLRLENAPLVGGNCRTTQHDPLASTVGFGDSLCVEAFVGAAGVPGHDAREGAGRGGGAGRDTNAGAMPAQNIAATRINGHRLALAATSHSSSWLTGVSSISPSPLTA